MASRAFPELSSRNFVLRVPSVLHDLLLNPTHPKFNQVKLTAKPEPFHFDERLRRK